jgi:hypothetical protein
MADLDKAIVALKAALPPVTDPFSYLAIIESYLSPALLPTLYDILQDPELTQVIGWDLVHNLVSLPGSEPCLRTIARLGNPREVIIKVLETLELLFLSEEDDDDDSDGDVEEIDHVSEDVGASKETKKISGRQAAEPNQDLRTHGSKTEGMSDKAKFPSKAEKFVQLLSMLTILHKRIKTKYPSRFLAQTLQTVLHVYRPNPLMTAAVIMLVSSLASSSRPPLPTRKSSVNVANPDQDGDTSKNAPDPEADHEGGDAGVSGSPAQAELQERMLLSFTLSVLEVFVNNNEMAWAARLVEFYQPERIIPGRKTLMAAFRELPELSELDQLVGELVVRPRASPREPPHHSSPAN